MFKHFCILAIAFFLLAWPYDAAKAWENYKPVNQTVYLQGIEPGNILIVNEDDRSNQHNFPVRFYGIGIPNERQPYGPEAASTLREWLPIGSKMIISTVNRDEEGIISALVQYKDHSVNNRLIEQGLAWVDRFTCKAFFCRRWHIQEHLAIKEKRGIWSLNIPTPPWQWGNMGG